MKMLKTIGLFGMAALLMLTMFTGCGMKRSKSTAGDATNDTPQTYQVVTVTSTTDATTTTKAPITTTTAAPTTTTTAAPTTAPTTAPTNAMSAPFINENNYNGNINNITINPRYVYWDNGMLVAECFVINGYSHSVYDIQVKELTFRNGNDNVLASGAFGYLDSLSIAPHSYVVWTFRFSADCVYQYGSDLSFLSTYASTSNRY